MTGKRTKASRLASRGSADIWRLKTPNATSAGGAAQRPCQSPGKAHEAHDLLSPVYDWFNDGFDTADLKVAKALLEELK